MATETASTPAMTSEPTIRTTVPAVESTAQTSYVITTVVTSTTDNDDESDTNLILPIGIVVGAFLIGITVAIVGICIYKRHFHAKLRRQSTMPLTTDELGRSKNEKQGIQAPFSVESVEKPDDGYIEIKGQGLPKPSINLNTQPSSKSTKQNHPQERNSAPETFPRPKLTTPIHNQIAFNTHTNIQINSDSITVDNSEEDYYLDLLPDERQSGVSGDVDPAEQDDLYEDMSVATNISSKDYRSSKGYVNTPQKPPLAKKPLKSSLNQKDNLSGTSSSRIKPNIPQKPPVQKLFRETPNTQHHHTSSDSSRASSRAESEECYEHIKTNQTKGKTTVSRTSDNIVMYVNCVVNGIPEKHLETTEL